MSVAKTDRPLRRLQPCTSVAAMELWSQCYERWLTPLDVPRSGHVHYHLHHAGLLKQVTRDPRQPTLRKIIK